MLFSKSSWGVFIPLTILARVLMLNLVTDIIIIIVEVLLLIFMKVAFDSDFAFPFSLWSFSDLIIS